MVGRYNSILDCVDKFVSDDVPEGDSPWRDFITLNQILAFAISTSKAQNGAGYRNISAHRQPVQNSYVRYL